MRYDEITVKNILLLDMSSCRVGVIIHSLLILTLCNVCSAHRGGGGGGDAISALGGYLEYFRGIP